MGRMLRVVTHGGASSDPRHRDGPEEACRVAVAALRQGGSVVDAACRAVAHLEDDPRFNAGTGSNLRFDGQTIEMDASCMGSDGRFGGVTCIRRVQNPIVVAQAVLRTPHNILAGEGSERFARSLGIPEYDPWTERSKEKFDLLVQALASAGMHAEVPWDLDTLRDFWNFDVAVEEILGTDTVGAVVSDGRFFGAALSSGGIMGSLLGRVGDVPLPGCGLHVGERGAVACTGDGDVLTRLRLAGHVVRWLDAGMDPQEAAARAVDMVQPATDVGLIIVTHDGHAALSNRRMAWASLEAPA